MLENKWENNSNQIVQHMLQNMRQLINKIQIWYKRQTKTLFKGCCWQRVFLKKLLLENTKTRIFNFKSY